MNRLDALREAHFPTDFERLGQAKERLAFEELLLFQAGVAGAAGERKRAKPLEIQDEWIEEFFARLPFAPTNAQRRVVHEVAADMRKDRAMARMVQGDVGCGKTLIAFCALYLCVRAGGQAALMAPTEILASQHLQSAVETLAPMGVTCGLLTGNMTAAEKRRAKEAIATGAWQVVIGTHALISEGVEFANLRLTVTDEQHRFGVRQRTMLENKGDAPHVMVMSATPIPRTLSLVLYGDLDLSAVDEMPPGRTPSARASCRRRSARGCMRLSAHRRRRDGRHMSSARWSAKRRWTTRICAAPHRSRRSWKRRLRRSKSGWFTAR